MVLNHIELEEGRCLILCIKLKYGSCGNLANLNCKYKRFHTIYFNPLECLIMSWALCMASRLPPYFTISHHIIPFDVTTKPCGIGYGYSYSSMSYYLIIKICMSIITLIEANFRWGLVYRIWRWTMVRKGCNRWGLWDDFSLNSWGAIAME